MHYVQKVNKYINILLLKTSIPHQQDNYFLHTHKVQCPKSNIYNLPLPHHIPISFPYHHRLSRGAPRVSMIPCWVQVHPPPGHWLWVPLYPIGKNTPLLNVLRKTDLLSMSFHIVSRSRKRRPLPNSSDNLDTDWHLSSFKLQCFEKRFCCHQHHDIKYEILLSWDISLLILG